MYSSLIQKRCKCGCSRYPTMGYEGYNMDCRPDLKEKKLSQQKERQKKANAVVKSTRELNKIPESKAPKDYAELDRFFKEMQKRMTGKCENCGGKTEAFTKHFKNSIAHILPKAYFKSVATNENNWLELCFYSNSCHSQMDNKMIDLIDMNCFDQIITRFAKMYPFIAPEEKRRIPPILIEYLKTEL